MRVCNEQIPRKYNKKSQRIVNKESIVIVESQNDKMQSYIMCCLSLTFSHVIEKTYYVRF